MHHHHHYAIYFDANPLKYVASQKMLTILSDLRLSTILKCFDIEKLQDRCSHSEYEMTTNARVHFNVSVIWHAQ